MVIVDDNVLSLSLRWVRERDRYLREDWRTGWGRVALLRWRLGRVHGPRNLMHRLRLL